MNTLPVRPVDNFGQKSNDEDEFLTSASKIRRLKKSDLQSNNQENVLNSFVNGETIEMSVSKTPFDEQRVLRFKSSNIQRETDFSKLERSRFQEETHLDQQRNDQQNETIIAQQTASSSCIQSDAQLRPRGRTRQTANTVQLNLSSDLFVLRPWSKNFNSRHKYSSTKLSHDLSLPAPLSNLGNTCYLNASLQTMFSCEIFTKTIKDAFRNSVDTQEKKNALTTRALLDIYEKYKQECEKAFVLEGSMDEDLKKFKNSIHGTFCNSRQQDAIEFMSILLNKIDEELKDCDKRPIQSVMKLTDEVTIKCANCPEQNVQPKAESHFFLNVHIPDKRVPQDDELSLQHCVNNFFKNEFVQSQCSICRLDQKQKTHDIKVFPKVLMLQLSRYTKKTKRHDPIYVPKVIRLPRKSMEANNEYELISVIVHHGSTLNSGHYISFNICKNQWCKCDDMSISKTSFKQVQESSIKTGYCFWYLNSKP